EGLLVHGEGQLLLDALQFEDRTARSVLLPLEELVTVPPTVTPATVEALAGQTGFSRFPVRTDDGTLTGYVHLKDLLADDDARDAPINTAVPRALPNVAVTDRLRLVLQTMQRSRAHLARVRDEMGSVIGVVALEDVLEELVGEVRDETRRASA
ncbi:MAG: CBS domain-containing protein, partial [Patulibacter sp.]|nr:CBS domain-containing protein [Patulibacter sp.]